MRTAAVLNALLASSALGVGLPGEFETPGDGVQPLFAYFGGVGGILTMTSVETVYEGNSQEIAVQWQPDPVFDFAGAVVGDHQISGADLNVPLDAALISVTIKAPPTGTFSLEIVLGEDDDGDGAVARSAGTTSGAPTSSS